MLRLGILHVKPTDTPEWEDAFAHDLNEKIAATF